MKIAGKPTENAMSANSFRVMGIVTFFWGWLYYLVTPALLGKFYVSNSFPLYHDVQSLLISMNWHFYWTLLFSILFSFACGIFLSKNTPNFKLELVVRPAPIHKIVLVALLCVQFVLYYNIKEYLFKGYAGLSWDAKDAVKSFISGLNITLGVIAIYNFHVRRHFKYVDWLPVAINSIILLGLGGRMYVLNPLCALIIYMLLSKKWSIARVAIVCSISTFLMLIIGVIRSSDAVDAARYVYIFIGEPILNWIGGANFIVTNKAPAFEAPVNMLAPIASFIPTAIWPEKFAFLNSLDSEFIVDTPLGGSNILIGLFSTFGSTGYMIFLLALGFATGLLAKVTTKHPLVIPFYASHLSLLCFMIWRDPLYIYEKCLLVNSFALPLALIILSPMISRMLNPSAGYSSR